MANKKGIIEPLHLIVGILLILSGLLYIFANNQWGVIIASIGLLIEAIKSAVK